MTELLTTNLLSPVTLAFALGIVARLLRSELAIPKEMYAAMSIYLLFTLGLQGGHELRLAAPSAIAGPAAATLLLGLITPLTTYMVVRWVGRFSTADAAALAAHYGSVSAVTYIAAVTFVKTRGLEPEGFMPTLLTLLESPGIHVALAIGALRRGGGARPTGALLHEVLTGRTMILLVGGLLVGLIASDTQWKAIAPFYDTTGSIFRGVLCLFMLEMGMLAAARLGDLKTVGLPLVALGIGIPIAHGALGVWLGLASGLSIAGATVLGTMAASASYIAAPPAVRLVLPEANPTIYLTAALAITFPFNLLLGIPLYFEMALLWGS